MTTAQKKNTILIYINSLLIFQGFSGPVLMLIYTRHIGLSMDQYLFLDGLLFITMAIFEIPSGIISDKIGRKKAIIIGQFFEIIALLILLFANDFTWSLIAILIFGIFSALKSGNAHAIYYENFKNKLNNLEHILATASSMTFAISILYSLASGFIANYNIVIPLILDIFIYSISFICVIIFLTDEQNRETRGYIKTKDIISNLNISQLIIMYKSFLSISIIYALSRVSFSFYQPMFVGFQINLKYFGIILALCNLICAISARVYSHSVLKANEISKKENKKTSFMVFFSLILLITMGIPNIYISFLSIIFQQILRAISVSYLSIETNKQIDSIDRGNEYRSTMVSFQNLMTTSLISFSLFISSVVMKNTNVFFALVAIVVFIIFLILIKKLK